MKQANRQAPVFKPLSNTENSSLFNFESQASNARTSAPVPFMRTNENQLTGVQTKLTQNQDVGTERLSSLHAKLHQEADKIRKWKVQTEIELKQKEKKIQEASSTNESLRKSILELQLQSENLSLKLQEEIGNREDVIQRISSTRQLCNILKDHAVKLEEKLHQCETERTELKYLEKDHLQQFEELSTEFKKLEISSVEIHNSLVNQLELERDDRRKLEEQLESKLNEAEIQLKVLMDQCDEKDIEIRDVRTMLQRNDEKIHTLEQSIASLQERSERQIADIHSKDSVLETTSEQLLCTQKQKLHYEEKLTEITEKLEGLRMEKHSVEQNMVSSRAEYDGKLVTLEQQCVELKSSLLSEIEKVKKYEEQLSETTLLSENLKSSKDILTLENTKLEGIVAALNNDLTECQKRIDEHMEVHATLTETYRQLNVQLEESKVNTDMLQNQTESGRMAIQQREKEIKILHEKVFAFETIIKEKEEVIQTSLTQHESLKSQLQTTMASNHELQAALEEEREAVKQALHSIDDAKEEIANKSKEITSRDCTMSKLRKDNEKVQKDLKKAKEENENLRCTLGKAEEENEQLTLKGQDLQVVIDELKEEQAEHDKSLDSEMKSKSKKVSDLENKHKELKGELTSKNKLIKELEKEIKGMKSKLNSQVKATQAKTKEYTELQEELEMMKLSSDNIQLNLSSLDEELKAARSSENQAVKQMENMKTKVEKSLKEKKDTEDKCEFQLSQMMATMDKYKKENNKIVQQKEKELELLKSKSDDFSAQKQQKDFQYEEMRKSNEEMKSSLDEALSEKNELLLRLSSQKETLESLQKKMVAKKTEIAELQDSVRSLAKQAKQKKKTLTSQTQTSPKSSPVSRQMTKTLATTPQRPNGDAQPSEKQTPQHYLKTPQRSILRNVNSVSKRRKVAFASHDDSGRHSASDSDSSSELMEVEMENVESRYKTNVKSTPLVIRPSPKARPSPKPVTPDVKMDTLPKTPLIRVPRGPPVNLKDKKQIPKKDSIIDDEKEMFKHLFPDTDRQKELIYEKENIIKKTDQDSNHLRKTPSKSTSKFFKASAKERISKMPKKLEKEEIAWFDLDSVFGFED